jgi:N-acyl-D-amino-acid deacylase
MLSTTVVIKGGSVVDGTGRPAVPADVLIAGGTVAEIGPGLVGEEVVDAAGCVVAPGFIDIHTHYDAQVSWDPALTPSSFHGVTSVIAGNCGFSLAPTRPEHRELIALTLENVEDMSVATLRAGVRWDFESFPDYLASVARAGTALNFGAYLGHTALRLFVMGTDAYGRVATEQEVAAMAAILADGLAAGAAGFSTSFSPSHRGAAGKPIPSRFADRAELEALLRVVAQARVGVVSCVPGGDVLPPEDLYDLQRATGVPFTFGAILSRPNGGHRDQLLLNQRGRAAGAQVWPQVSPRPLQFGLSMAAPFTLNPNPEFASLMGGSIDDRRRAYADPEWRARAVRAAAEQTVLKPRWDAFFIQAGCGDPSLVGQSLAEIGARRGLPPLLALVDLALAEKDLDLAVSCVIANDDADEVARILTDPGCTLGLSDAGAHVSQLCDAPQGTDFLGNWVRDRSLMPIEQGVRRLTGLQADILGLPGRGYLTPGAAADVVVFDPATIAPGPIRKVSDFPGGGVRLTAPEPVGMRHVFVNGTPIRVDEKQLPPDVLPGQLLKPARRPG